MGSPLISTLLHPIDDVVKLCASFEKPAPKRVLLVGATASFLGPFLVAAFLREDRRLVVCCLVDNDEDAGVKEIQRLCSAACCWDDDFLPRLFATVGDASRRWLGMDEEKCIALNREVDMVVCIGDGGNGGFAHYLDARKRLLLPLINVLHFCNVSNRKPLHFLSALQQFPSFFTRSASTILEDSAPDTSEMKTLFSTESLGTPWAFWSAEQLLQRGHTDLHVYRLPDVFMGGASGLPRTDHFATAFLTAIIQEAKIPKGALPITITPADVICDLLAKLMLKDKPKHSIYHLLDNRVLSGEDLCHWANGVALFCELVDHSDFIAAVQERGDKSALSGFLPLLLEWQNCWFGNNIKSLPVADANLWDDLRGLCPFAWPHPRPNLEASFSDCLERLSLDENSSAVVLDVERLFEEARRLSGCSELSDETFFLEGARKLLSTVQREACASLAVKRYWSYTTRSSLLQALLMEQKSKQDSSVQRVVIRQPIIIVGHHRAGSSFFLDLLSRDQQYRAPRHFELFCPMAIPERHEADSGCFPRDTTDTRVASVTRQLGCVTESKNWSSLHNVKTDCPYEMSNTEAICFRLHWLRALFPGSSYGQWIWANDGAEIKKIPPYACRVLQHLQRPGDQWVLKWLNAFPDETFKTFPDARAVSIHRDPKKRVASWSELVYKIAKHRGFSPDKHKIGKEVLSISSHDTCNLVKLRKEHPEYDIFDIQFHEMTADPLGTVQRMYDHFGMVLSPEARTAMELYVAKVNVNKTSSPGKHSKILEEFGLTEADIEAAFSDYYRSGFYKAPLWTISPFLE
eukprot:GHVS01062306.1.p1 GENE.GHVS01062306.1~~GHVS01062306.1.p1  ORF type:complete len:803 (-),score=82.36 GHVS01062306.1:166-2574(-)